MTTKLTELQTKLQLDSLLRGATDTGTGTSTGGGDHLSGLTGGAAAPTASGTSTAAGGAGGLVSQTLFSLCSCS